MKRWKNKTGSEVTRKMHMLLARVTKYGDLKHLGKEGEALCTARLEESDRTEARVIFQAKNSPRLWMPAEDLRVGRYPSNRVPAVLAYPGGTRYGAFFVRREGGALTLNLVLERAEDRELTGPVRYSLMMDYETRVDIAAGNAGMEEPFMIRSACGVCSLLTSSSTKPVREGNIDITAVNQDGDEANHTCILHYADKNDLVPMLLLSRFMTMTGFPHAAKPIYAVHRKKVS